MTMQEELDKLKTFGRENDGNYCDRWEFSIVKNICSKTEQWDFCHFNEVDGSLYFIKHLKDIDDLRNVYKAITDKELE